MMRHLIINADDLGLNQQRTHGILMCHEQGIVTSASLVVTTSDSEKAARHASHRDLPTGLHINLTWGSPLSKKSVIESLLTTDGYFLGRDALTRALNEGKVDKLHAEREVREQIEWFLEHRGFPTHVDSHHHMHVHPILSQMIVSVLDTYGVAYVRIPSEPAVPFGFMIDKAQSEYIEKLSAQAEEARKLYKAHGIKTSDHFRGLALVGNSSMRNMRHTLSRLSDGLTELMTHPGSAFPEGEPFDRDPQRQTEMNVLMNPETKEEMVEREIKLVSYADML